MEEKKNRITSILKELRKLYPNPRCALHYSKDYELLFAIIMSAQCTDKMVNIVTEKLYEKYTKLEDFVNAVPEEFEQDIRQTGFYKNKTKSILACAKMLKENFAGKVPDTMEELITLPGVARKTGNVMLGEYFRKNEGVTVDTHVIRLANLYGLTTQKDPVKIEKDLMQIIPREDWTRFSASLVLYGREYCPAKKHDHENCPLVNALQ